MEGYSNLDIRYLPSPTPKEEWFLLKGLAAGANGPNTRMRVYSFDGKTYKLRWLPENAWGRFTIKVSNSGFNVDGYYYRDGRVRHDSYQLSEDGLYRSPE